MKPVLFFLLVPLALASFGFSAMTPQQPSPAPVWRQSQKTDPARGTTYTRLTLVGKFVKSPQGDVSNRPAFVVDCVPGKGSRRGKFENADLLIGAAMKMDYVEPQEIHGTSYYPKIPLRYRIDDAKEEQDKWPPGADKASASVTKDWLKKVLRAHNVQITGEDDRGSEVVMQFDMPDPKPVEEACNVSDGKK
jgi:hypothetical protein